MSSWPDHDIQSDFKRLDKHSCEKILFQIEGSGVFAGIERGGFTAALLGGVHYNLFSDGEVLQFTNAVNNSDLFKPIRSACQRLGPQVLWAVYDTLLSTRDVPGAVQHASIASKLRECVQTLAMARPVARPTTTTYTVHTHQQDRFQGETAEGDRGLPKADQNRVTSKHVYTAEDEQPHYGRYQSAMTTADTGGGLETLSSAEIPSMTPGHGTHDHSRTMVNTAPSLGDLGTEGNEQNESDILCSFDWNSKEFVAMFTDHLVDGMQREEYQALANEILDHRPSSDRKVIKKQIHAAVLQRSISLYEMGRLLLSREILFVHIFKITEFTKAPITKEVKRMLSDHLGSLWEQLAYKMGMTRFTIKCLKNENRNNISAQIDKFLNGERQFPRLPTMAQTASLLVEIMEKASLPEVARDVYRAFLHLGLKENDVYPGRSDPYRPVDLQAVMEDITHSSSEDSEDISLSGNLTFGHDYQEALKKHGKVSIEVIRSLLVGPSGVGKSSLRHLLVHGKSKEITTSTPVMETPDILVVGEHYAVDDERSIWKQVTKDCLHDSLKQCTREGSYDGSPHYPSTIGSSSSDVQEENIVTHQDSRSEGNSVSHAPSTTQSTAANEEVNHLEAAYKAVLSSSPVPEYQIPLQNAKFIHVIDSGGQPAFQDILPLLLAIPCVYLQIFDASKGFHERIRSIYRTESGSEQQLPGAHRAETHWEFIQRSLSSMQTMAYKFKCRDLQTFSHTPPEFRIIFVGTFKDKIEDTHRVKASIQTSLNELITKPYFDNIHFAENEQFFLVDNHMTLHSSQADQETGCRYLNKLRECISNARYALKVDVPLMWILVEIITRSLDKKFIKEAELKEFCLKHEYIDQDRADEQFSCLLKLFHFLGFFAHHDLDLKYLKNPINYVCTDATSFYKEVSKLLAVQYSSPKSGATMAFRHTGVIRDPYDVLFELKISPNVDPVWFLEILHHLGIAARLDSNSSYFIPSCLPYRNAQVPDICSVGPLSLTYIFEKDRFTTHCDLPRSVFCRLVVELADKGWYVDTKGSDRTLIKFSIDETLVFLMEEPGHIRCELAVCEHFFTKYLKDEDRLQKLHQHCSTLYGTLLSTLKRITREIFGEDFQKSAQIHPVLPCATCQGNVQYTARMKDYNDCLATCVQCRLSQRLSPRQKVWFAPLQSSEARVLPQNRVAFWSLVEVKGVPRNTCGTSSMIPSKDIDGDTQSPLSGQNTFKGARFEPDSSLMRVYSSKGTSQVRPTRNSSTKCSSIGQGIFPGASPESDSSSVKMQSIEGDSSKFISNPDLSESVSTLSYFCDTSSLIPSRDASTLSSAIGQSMHQGVLSEPDSSLGQPSMPIADVAQLFEQFKGEFLNKGKIAAISITQKLYDDGVIPQDIQRRIEHASDDYNAASILYNHMKTQADREAAEKLFTIMIHSAGYHQMNDLGIRMMDCLPKGTSSMIPSMDIDEDIQSTLNGQSTFQSAQYEPDSSPMRVHSTEGTLQVLPTRNSSTNCSPIGQGIFPGASPESDSSSMKMQSTEVATQKYVPQGDSSKFTNNPNPSGSYSCATTSTGHALSTSSTVSQSTINAATSTGHAPSTSSTVSQSTINDKTPSDFRIKRILLHIPKWWDLAGRLGVPVDQVNDLREDPIMGGDQALAYWRDGRCGERFPTTWRFLLENVEELRGPQVAKKLREKAELDIKCIQ